MFKGGYIMKKRCFSLILIMCMFFSLTACGKTGKETEQNNEQKTEEKNTEESTEIETETETNIDMDVVEWNQKFRYDNGNIVSFNINSKVEVPKTTEMNMYHVKVNSLNDIEFKKNLLNYFKEDGEAYYDDVRYASADKLTEYIDSMKQLYSRALEDEQYLKNTQFNNPAELKSHIEEYEQYLDYSGDEFQFVKVYSYDCDFYYIKKNDILYIFYNDYIPENETTIYSITQNDLMKFAPEQFENSDEVNMAVEYYNHQKEPVDKELVVQDRKLAESVIGRMGYDIMSYDSSIRICWYNANEKVYEGDRLTYKAAIDGRKIFEPQPSSFEAHCFRQPEFILYIYNGKLLKINKNHSLNFYESVSSEKVQILDFEKIKKAFENEIEENWELYDSAPSNGMNIYDVRHISLEYVFVPNEDGNEGYLVPCYMFLYDDTEYDEKYIAINAIDGSTVYP